MNITGSVNNVVINDADFDGLIVEDLTGNLTYKDLDSLYIANSKIAGNANITSYETGLLSKNLLTETFNDLNLMNVTVGNATLLAKQNDISTSNAFQGNNLSLTTFNGNVNMNGGRADFGTLTADVQGNINYADADGIVLNNINAHNNVINISTSSFPIGDNGILENNLTITNDIQGSSINLSAKQDIIQTSGNIAGNTVSLSSLTGNITQSGGTIQGTNLTVDLDGGNTTTANINNADFSNVSFNPDGDNVLSISYVDKDGVSIGNSNLGTGSLAIETGNSALTANNSINEINLALNGNITAKNISLSALVNNISITNSTINTTGANSLVNIKANGDINLTDTSINSLNGISSIILNSDADSNKLGAVALTGSTIQSNGGDIIIGGGSNPVQEFSFGSPITGLKNGVLIKNSTLSTNGGQLNVHGQANNTDFAAGIGIQNSILDSGDGNTNLTGIGAVTTNGAHGVVVNLGSQLNSTTGDINITGKAGGSSGSANDGVRIDSSIIQSDSGNVNLLGESLLASGNFSRGVLIVNSSTLKTGELGNIILTGTGSSNGGSSNFGVEVVNGLNTLQVENGMLSITGTGGNGIGTGNNGVAILGNASIESTNLGAIEIVGLASKASAVFINQSLLVDSPTLNITGISSGTDKGVEISTTGSIGISTAGNINITGTSTGGVGIQNDGIIGGTTLGTNITLTGNIIQSDGRIQGTNLILDLDGGNTSTASINNADFSTVSFNPDGDNVLSISYADRDGVSVGNSNLGTGSLTVTTGNLALTANNLINENNLNLNGVISGDILDFSTNNLSSINLRNSQINGLTSVLLNAGSANNIYGNSIFSYPILNSPSISLTGNQIGSLSAPIAFSRGTLAGLTINSLNIDFANVLDHYGNYYFYPSFILPNGLPLKTKNVYQIDTNPLEQSLFNRLLVDNNRVENSQTQENSLMGILFIDKSYFSENAKSSLINTEHIGNTIIQTYIKDLSLEKTQVDNSQSTLLDN